jgi:DNA-binding FrmR family transcriptional regulator
MRYNEPEIPTPPGVGKGGGRVLPQYKDEALRRLKVAAGHLEAVRRMTEEERYCIDIMKQLAAVQASLEQVQQVLLKNHLSTCVSDAIRRGSGEGLIEELVAALKYTKGLGGEQAAPSTHCAPAAAGGREHGGHGN